ncbi:MAG TPA: hypothetical protein VMC48_01470 [Methanobacterium sp.]|nr:hypothetical protein [Methanobacterium sp.]
MKKTLIIAPILLGVIFLVTAIAAAPTSSAAATLSTPTLTSPANGVTLNHYPRTTTLAWKPVTSATYYKVERQYQGGSTWTSYPVVYVYGNTNTHYTFNFVGDQQGRWRVTAYGTSGTYSNPSSWYYFSYKTKFALATPKPISPANGANLYNYPRTTTLTWTQVPGATGYKIEKQFYSGGVWSSSSTATVSGVHNTCYTYNFVGMQPGRWRVTALDSTGNFYNSLASVWYYFTYHI